MAKMKTKPFPNVEYQKLKSFSFQKNAQAKRNVYYGLCVSIILLLFIFAVAIAMIVVENGILTWYFSASRSTQSIHNVGNLQCDIEDNNRFDCWPEKIDVDPVSCANRGCCWKPSLKPETLPYCFFPKNYKGYNATDIKETSTGLEATLVRKSSSFYPSDIKVLKLKVDFQTHSRLRIKIYDPQHDRYEVPLAVPTSTSKCVHPQYNVSVAKVPFSIMVTRKSTGETIFDTSDMAPLTFSDQFLQISTKLSTKFIYGLGEHRNDFLIDVSKWGRYVFWNRDDVPKVNNNGYGTHPFFLNLEKGRDKNIGGTQNNAHGIFLLNSNAGEIAIQPYGEGSEAAVTYRFLGGVFDFFVVTGPEAGAITSQLVDVIGRPNIPPFWALGFHLCRWGYNSSEYLSKVVERNRLAEMPYDVQWNDIDYMDSHKDWTYDQKRYRGLPDIVSDLHKNNQKYIIMADPAISSSSAPGTYPPFDDGKQLDVFIKDHNGQILIGQVWPGNTAFPDFFHPNAEHYWYKQAKNFHDKIPFDGLWIDMNEPSNFVDGSTNGCPESQYNKPPYLPPTIDSGSLTFKTICPTAKQSISLHYNVHNMYGWSQANVTRRVLNHLLGKRSPIISRSTFPGLAVNAGHWLGDNLSTFKEMYFSIPGILNFNLFGLPQVGADICGFRGSTTNELCTRWMQLGAFYPFMRNHASIDSEDQDPGVFPSPYRDYMRSALQLRYSLLAVLYTAFYDAHVTGLPIVRPLMFYYRGTEAIDSQFLWGHQLLISPVLTQGATSVQAFLPDDVWYDFYNGTHMPNVGQNVILEAPLDHINVHIRGGSILPLLPPTQRTYLSQMEKFELVCGPDDKGNARGRLFWDDGDSFNTIPDKKYTELEFIMQEFKSFYTRVLLSGYKPSHGIRLGKLMLLNIQKEPMDVSLNGKTPSFSYDSGGKTLMLFDLDEDLTLPMTAQWQ